MASITWPTSLPARPISMQDMPMGNFLRSDMEVGPPKTRRRSTASLDKIQMTFQMNEAEVGIFETFYNESALGGVVPFDYTHPRTGTQKAWTFLDPYVINPLGGTEYSVSFTLQVSL